MSAEKFEPDTNSYNNKSLEKGAPEQYVAPTDDRYRFSQSDLDRVQRRLKQRHVQMIAVSAIGSCFSLQLNPNHIHQRADRGDYWNRFVLGSGSALHKAGPLGALLAYLLVGTVAYSSLCSIGEMTALAPISGTFPHFAARWVQPSFGAAVSPFFFFWVSISIPVEITAATILITFWDDNHKHQAGYTAVLCFLVCLINVFGVRYFGESEFVFSIIKLTLITGLILCGLIIDLGGGPTHHRLGFTYWKHPGALNGPGLVKSKGTDHFLGWLSVLVQAGFSFQGMELVAIAASETENPRRNISKAVRRVFWRIAIFYILGIIITGMLVPFDDPDLLNGNGTASQSPYVIAIRRAGIHTLPSIINAAIFTSAFSAGNSFLFCSSRVLYGLSVRGQAPSFFSYCTKGGLPIVAVLTCCSFSLLSFMNVSSNAAKVFNWFVNLSTSAGFFSWWAINLTYIRFWRGHKVQGRDLKELAYNNPLQPGLAIWGVFWTSVFILVDGYQVFFKWNTQDFLTGYINIPIFFALWIGWTIYMRQPFWRAHEMDFVTGIPTIEETDAPEVPPRNLSEKIFNAIF
ncbi:general amino acid permease 1 [Multifurca ochricompacta]|uniref:General amino acid permease 1 n=1 Tax=Multifurca ochricompacta TaxID=376703 RepID=A0AAD4M8K0_9AGAM|nr:general amino acid permease 1 [Multifurca ochricompacta]